MTSSTSHSRPRSSSPLWRTRWAAIGAAVAVALGAGGIGLAGAGSSPSSLVTIEPVRVLDTRIPVGLDGPLHSGRSASLDVTGTIPIATSDTTTGSGMPVPDGATGIVANVTVVSPTTIGWVSALGGYGSAVALDASIAGAMGMVATGCFALALLAAPRYGVLARLAQRRRRRRRVAELLDRAGAA